MKKTFSLIVSLLLFVSCFSQSVKNLNSQPNIRPVNSTRFSALDPNGLIKNVRFDEMKDSIQAPLNVQINQKLQASVLSDSLLQIRSDLATKEQLQAVEILKDSMIIMYNQIALNSTSNVTIDINSVKNSYWGSSPRDGWHGLYITSASHVFATTFTNLGPRKTGATSYDGNTTSETVKNGYILLVRFKNSVITHHSIFTAGWLYTNDEIKAAQDSITAHRSDIDSEAAARVAGDALRPTFGNLSDSLKGVFRGRDTTINSSSYVSHFANDSKLITPNGKFRQNGANANLGYNYNILLGINIANAFANYANSDWTYMTYGTAHNLFDFRANRTNYGNRQYQTKGANAFMLNENGSITAQGENIVSSKDGLTVFDSVRNYYTAINSLYPATKWNTIGNGVGLNFRFRRNSVWAYTGIEFYNQFNQDSIDFAYNPQKGHLISIRDEGKLAVKRRDGNLINTYDRVLTDNEVKSKTLTLATSSTPALDFESGIIVTYTLTTALEGNFFPTVTTANIRDGGRYVIRFNAIHTGNVFTFPANVYKKDGSAFGAYSVVSEILDFVAIGSNLYCINK